MRDGVRVSLEQLVDTAERERAALHLEELFEGVLAELCGEEELGSSAKCLRERICADGVRVTDRDVRMVFVRSGAYKWGLLF